MVGDVDNGAFRYAHKDPSVLSYVLNKNYNLLEKWMHANKLVINPDKTNLMVMASRKNDINRKKGRKHESRGIYHKTISDRKAPRWSAPSITAVEPSSDGS